MADFNWDRYGDDDDEDEGDEGESQRFQWGSKDGLIFLIDCTEAMFEQGDDGSPFDLCIKCAKNVIQTKIISSDKDLLGIVFFGTEKDQNPGEFKHIFICQELALPGRDQVLQLEDFLEEPENDDFKNQFGHSNNYSLSDALWTCSNMFSSSEGKLGFKRVMLFTNNDNPHSNNPQLRRQAATKVDDLHQNGVGIELMHINKPDQIFDVSLFYKDVLFSDDDENIILPDASEKFDELLTRVRSKDHKKRAQARIPLSFGEGLNMSVGIYNLVRPCTVPYGIKLYNKTNEEVKSISKTFIADTGEVLMPQDMKKCHTYAGRKIMFENEEVAEMKKFYKPGIQLMGFKPRSRLKRYFHIRPAQFLYPDDKSIQGSSTLFSAMLKKCLEKDVIAICRYIPRRNAPPKFVALLPQAEELDDQKVQVTPPGFHVIFLPFADDFRKLKFDEEAPRANTDQIDKAKEIIKKLDFPFNSESFENPRLQKHHVNVEALALDRDNTEEIEDFTLPNPEVTKKRAGRALEEFKDLVFPEDYVPGAKKKRAGGGTAAKKPVIDIDVENEARQGRIGKLTVPVLKEYVKQAKVKTSGTKKAELIEAINSHLGL